MSYLERLQPWCIIRCFPTLKSLVVARFRKRSEAEAYLKALRQLTYTSTYQIVFDLPIKSQTNQQKKATSHSSKIAE